MMVDIDKSPDNGTALLHLYKTYCVLNGAAGELLGLLPGKHVRFRQDPMELAAGRDRVYVCLSDYPLGYPAKQRAHTWKIFSTRLCRSLAGHLQGEGTYRICAEVTRTEDGVKYYEIFFKRYDKVSTH